MPIPTPPVAPGADAARSRMLDRRFWFRLYVAMVVLGVFIVALESSLLLRLAWGVVAVTQALAARQQWRNWHTLGRWIDPPDAARRRQVRQRKRAMIIGLPILFALGVFIGLVR